MNSKTEALTQEERAFLHDISTPLSALSLSVDLVLEYMETSPPPADKVQQKLEKIKAIIRKMVESIQTRRELLIERSETKSI